MQIVVFLPVQADVIGEPDHGHGSPPPELRLKMNIQV
jgi:hypothetical protein